MKRLWKFLLKLMLKMDNLLYRRISSLAIRYEGGMHPKHRLMHYQEFFARNVEKGERVFRRRLWCGCRCL